MKKLMVTLFLLFSISSYGAVEIPEDFPAEVCQGLEQELNSFAKDLATVADQMGLPEVQAQEAFYFILMEVGMAISETPADCEYALDFTKRKHNHFLEEAAAAGVDV